MPDLAELTVVVSERGVSAVTAGLNNLHGTFGRAGAAVIGFNQAMDLMSRGFRLVNGIIDSGVSHVRTWVSAASAQEDALTQLNQTLVSTGRYSQSYSQELQALASSLEAVTTFSDDMIERQLSILLTFTKLGRETVPEAAEAMLDLAAKMGGDLQGASIQLGKALQDPIAGMTALRRSGVSFTDEQERQVKQLLRHNDLLGAQKVVLKEMATEFGGSARAAAATFSGQVLQLNNTLDNLHEELGAVVTNSRTVRDSIDIMKNMIVEATGGVNKFRTEGDAAEQMMRRLADGTLWAAEGVARLTLTFVEWGEWIQTNKTQIKYILDAMGLIAIGAKNTGAAVRFFATSGGLGMLPDADFTSAKAGIDATISSIDTFRDRLHNRRDLEGWAADIKDVEGEFTKLAGTIKNLPVGATVPVPSITRSAPAPRLPFQEVPAAEGALMFPLVQSAGTDTGATTTATREEGLKRLQVLLDEARNRGVSFSAQTLEQAGALKLVTDAAVKAGTAVAGVNGAVGDDEAAAATLASQAKIYDDIANSRMADLQIAKDLNAPLTEQLAIAQDIDRLNLQSLETERQAAAAKRDAAEGPDKKAEAEGELALLDRQIASLKASGTEVRSLYADWQKTGIAIEEANNPLLKFQHDVAQLHQRAAVGNTISPAAAEAQIRQWREQTLGVRDYRDELKNLELQLTRIRQASAEGIGGVDAETVAQQEREWRRAVLSVHAYRDEIAEFDVQMQRVRSGGPLGVITDEDVAAEERNLRRSLLNIDTYEDRLAEFEHEKTRRIPALVDAGKISPEAGAIEINKQRMQMPTWEGAFARSEHDLRSGISDTLKGAFSGEDLDWKEVATKLVGRFTDALYTQAADSLTDLLFGSLLGTSKGSPGLLSQGLAGITGSINSAAPGKGPEISAGAQLGQSAMDFGLRFSASPGAMGPEMPPDIGAARALEATDEAGAAAAAATGNAFSNAAHAAGSAFLDVAGDVGHGFMSAVNFLGNGLGQLFGGQAGSSGSGMWGSVISGVVGIGTSLFGGGAGAGTSTTAQLMGNAANFGETYSFHHGGVARCHDGGVIQRYHGMSEGAEVDQLLPGEVPAILEVGELVVPRRLTGELRNIFDRQSVRRFHEGGIVPESSGPLVPFDLVSQRSGRSADRAKSRDDKVINQHITMPLGLVVQSIDPSTATSQIMRNEQVILGMVSRNLRHGGRLAVDVGQRR